MLVESKQFIQHNAERLARCGQREQSRQRSQRLLTAPR
jgi:hypothetical protein